MGRRPMKYNPSFLTEDELVESFVVREVDLNLILDVIRENRYESNQHVLIIGPRGIGKTMFVLRVAAAIRRSEELNRRWFPLISAEENYQATTAGEFWLESLFHLADRTGDVHLMQSYNELRLESDEARLHDRALAQLLDFADARDKRILLIVENLNQMLADFRNKEDAWAIRHTLQNEPRLMLLATATKLFDEIKGINKALFEAFTIYELKPLNVEECGRLWASTTGEIPGLNRMRPIEILTGGNPRLLTVLALFGVNKSFRELMEDLASLVDDHTDYFKGQIDRLAPIERKAFLVLAEIWDPATARQVAENARINVNKASALLNRLVDRGAVTVVNLGPKRIAYQVSERLYNVYYLMRRRGISADRVQLVVKFMVHFYEPEKLVDFARRIAEEGCGINDPQLRRDHRSAVRGLLENIPQELKTQFYESMPRDFLDPSDITVLSNHRLKKVINSAIELREKHKKPEGAVRYLHESIENAPESHQYILWNLIGFICEEDIDQYKEAEKVYRKAIDLEPTNPWGWSLLGQLLHEKLDRFEEAEMAYRKALDLKSDYVRTWVKLGQLLHEKVDRFEEAEKVYRTALDIKSDDAWRWVSIKQILHEKLERFEEAEKVYRTAIDPKSDRAMVWTQLGLLLHEKLNQFEEAEEAFRKAIDLKSDYAWAWAMLGQLLHEKLERFHEAEEAYRKAIELESDDGAWTWAMLGQLLYEKLERFHEAEKAYRKAIELNSDDPGVWAMLGQLLHEKLERFQEAEKAYRKAIDLDSDDGAWTWAMLGLLLYEKLERFQEAEKAYRKAIELNSDDPGVWAMLGQLLHEKLDRFEEAEKAYQKAIDLQSDDAGVWSQLGRLLHDKLKRFEEAEEAYRKALDLMPDHMLVWADLCAAILAQSGRHAEALKIANDIIDKYPNNAELLNDMAWSFYKHGPTNLRPQALVWSRRSVDLNKDDSRLLHTLAFILTSVDESEEARKHLRIYLKDSTIIQQNMEDSIQLIVEFAARGHTSQTLEALRESPSAKLMEPIIVGLQLNLGETPLAAVEIMEVAKDVLKRIEERRENLIGSDRKK